MCGIVGILSHSDATERLLEGLSRLEYRGYDSAGVALMDEDGQIDLRRSVGKLSALRGVLEEAPLAGRLGIGHTRWATHGAPTEVNAHPHRTGNVTLVHNGIIENYAALRSELEASGVCFASDTDTEVAARLLESFLPASETLEEAFRWPNRFTPPNAAEGQINPLVIGGIGEIKEAMHLADRVKASLHC